MFEEVIKEAFESAPKDLKRRDVIFSVLAHLVCTNANTAQSMGLKIPIENSAACSAVLATLALVDEDPVLAGNLLRETEGDTGNGPAKYSVQIGREIARYINGQ